MCGLGTFCQLPSIFCTAGRPSDKFHQHSVRPVDYSTSFVHFLCSRETFRQLSSILLAAIRLSVNFRHFCALPEQLLSTFRAVGHSVNFHQLSVWPGDVPSILSTFCVAGSTSANFRQLSLWLEIFCKLASVCGRETYRHISSTFHAAGRDSIIIHELSMCPEDLPSTLVRLVDLLTTFYAPGRLSVNFRQLFVRLGELWSTSVNILCGWENFRKLS